MAISIRIIDSSWCFRNIAFISVSGVIMRCLRSIRRGKMRHLCSALIAVSLRIWSVFHPWLLMSLRWRTIAHDDSTIFLAANHTIFSVISIFVFILRNRSINRSRLIVTFLINLFLYWFKLMLLLLTRRMIVLIMDCSIRVLGIGICMMMSTSIAIDLSLSWWTSIRHRNIVWSRTRIPQRTVFWSIFWARIGIGRAACTTCIITWEVVG